MPLQKGWHIEGKTTETEVLPRAASHQTKVVLSLDINSIRSLRSVSCFPFVLKNLKSEQPSMNTAQNVFELSLLS
jgi:hypothetical protein